MNSALNQETKTLSTKSTTKLLATVQVSLGNLAEIPAKPDRKSVV